MTSRITVIGGANVDIGGRPAAALALRDSNPGLVGLRFCGVGRNVAQNLCLLGEEVSLVSAFGGDLYGGSLRESCLALGMDLSLSLVLPGRRSSVYLYVTDEKGEMLVGIADMDITEEISPSLLESIRPHLNAADAVVVDANLSESALRWIAENITVPLYADPVSAAKAPRLRPLLGRLRALKPNAAESAALTGETDETAAVRALLRLGVQRVFLSRGARGLLAAEGETLLALPCEDLPVVNTTGAGDAALAAVVCSDLRGQPLERCARTALHAGALTCACTETNTASLKDLTGAWSP